MKFLVAKLALLACHGCAIAPHQSVLHPQSEAAATIANLWWGLLFILSIVTLIVFILLGWSVWRTKSAAPRPPGGDFRFILIGGVIFPTAIVAGLQVLALDTNRVLWLAEAPLTIDVTGVMWWWDVRYDEHDIVIANEIYIPVGVDVNLRLHSRDVIHSLWIPNLHGKMDAMPDHANIMTIRASSEGVFRGVCAEFCGLQHARMGLVVFALEEERFDEWLREKKNRPLLSDVARRGEEVFFEASCHECHAIAWTRAEATVGPDLTHMGSRATIGAGLLENTPGNLIGWIANPQALKPGANMPRN